MKDEGPSAEDLARFNRDHGYCPECGAEIWDQAPYCPECSEYIAGRTSARPPVERWWRWRWMLLVVIIVLIAFFLRVI